MQHEQRASTEHGDEREKEKSEHLNLQCDLHHLGDQLCLPLNSYKKERIEGFPRNDCALAKTTNLAESWW